MNRNILALCLAACGCAIGTGCANEASGRDWREYDRRAEYKDSNFQFVVDKKDGVKAEIVQKNGCLVIEAYARVIDRYDIWYVYECDDWKTDRMGIRSSKKSMVTDPPGKTYPGVTGDANIMEVPSEIRKQAGSRDEVQDLAMTPIKVEWQIASGDGREFVKNDDPNWIIGAEILCRRGKQDFTTREANVQINLCDAELKKLLSQSAQEFHIVLRLSPENWAGSERVNPAPFVYYLRQPITKEMIQAALDSLR